MCNKCNCETAKSSEPIPFDLEAAKRGEPIQTRDGRKATFIGLAPVMLAQGVVAYVEGDNYVRFYCDDGKYLHTSKSQYDLVMAPKPKKSLTKVLYLLVAKNGKNFVTASSKKPGEHSYWKCIGSKEVTITEGDSHETF